MSLIYIVRHNISTSKYDLHKIVLGILGHSQVLTTMNLYSHMFKENQVKTCDAVANSIGLTKNKGDGQ